MLARALTVEKLCPEVEGEDGVNRFLGIWAKNCAEWLISLFASMKVGATCVGFFDAMGDQTANSIAKTTEMTTIIGTKDYMLRVLDMKLEGLFTSVTTFISMDGGVANYIESAESVNLKLLDFDSLLKETEKKKDKVEMEEI